MILAEIGREPSILDVTSARVQAALAALDPGSSSAARRPPPDPTLFAAPEVLDELTRMFRGKCGYCESELGPATVDNVDHYRPPRDALGSDGSVSPDHYWWLAYTWANLILACTDCIKHKGARFPVVGERIGPDDQLSAEQPLLVNPRDHLEDPYRLLVFQADGTVASTDARGIATIEVLALNRRALVKARAQVWAEVTAGLATVGYVPDDRESFHAMRIQLVTDDTRTRTSAKAGFEQSQTARQQVSLEPTPGATTGDAHLANYYAATRWMERIELHNVRPIRHLELDLTASTTTTAPWEVLLGDNGSGKSSILMAVALAMVGADHRRSLTASVGLTPAKVLRRGCRRGWVKVWLTGLPDPVTLTFDRDSDEFGGTSEPQAVVLGYGAMRLRGSSAPVRQSGVSNVANLFDPRHDLVDPATWLADLDDATFADVAASMRLLLALDDQTFLERNRRRGTIWVRFGKSREPLDQLSDGYQTMMVLAADILSTAFSLWSSPATAEGIVIIDELGTHLHPRWRMRVVDALRRVLPRMQFLASTHDPLCLRGLGDGEVSVILRNPDGDVVSLTDLPSVKGLRVEQLLTSEHFGLGSTQDPHVDDLFKEYYALRALPHPDADEQTRLAAIDAELVSLRQLGTSERERLVLEAADGFLAERRVTGDATVLRTEVKSQLRSLWEQALPQETP
ncbi:AAA family ATPase [Aestuariimicrobium soli]|uniref:AAA family ATPase n=1 Tax=Aestuariimicrobium soli TaxID=2035834 RepID=UPI003EBD29AD